MFGAMTLKVGGRNLTFDLLFPSDAKALKRVTTWLMHTPNTNTDGMNPWDVAHQVSNTVPGPDGTPTYVEPDVIHAGTFQNRAQATQATLVVDGNTVVVNGPNAAWAASNKFGYHLGDAFTQLKSARDAVGATKMKAVRIAHLDVGYDKKQVSMPENINTALEWNFVENTDDAQDPGDAGLLDNPGHGTGTIAILAGAKVSVFNAASGDTFDDYLGGAPLAEIIPVRIADSVIHLYTSSMAKGLDYAVSPRQTEPPVDVVSVSMGGLPTRAWAEAVNRAYEAGVTIVAATGDNIGGLPTVGVVWPARFGRVIGATGIAEDYTPYFKQRLSTLLQGNFGPPSAMDHAIAAFTPNTFWPELGQPFAIDLDGGGTSAATPQIASAAALWLANYYDKLGAGWQRVEAVRRALFSSARRDLPESQKYYGNGVLQAESALAIQPAADLTMTPPDDVWFPFLTILFGWSGLAPNTAKMFEVETAQLYASSQHLQQLYPDLDVKEQVDFQNLQAGANKAIAQAISDLQTVSKTLRAYLLTAISKM
jgi:hypothetical protein